MRPSTWTGGQYSLFRGVLGVVLVLSFARLWFAGDELLAPSAGGAVTAGGWLPNVLQWARDVGALDVFVGVAVLLSLSVLVGWRDRWAALPLWYLMSCAAGLVAGGTAHWMILALLVLGHLVQPSAPYGSWAARGRPDPGGGWTFDRTVWIVLWIFLALDAGVAAASGWGLDGDALMARLAEADVRAAWRERFAAMEPGAATVLAQLVSLVLTLVVPMALVPRLRPAAWFVLVLLNLGGGVVFVRGEELVAMAVAHLLAFDPGWLRPREAPGVASVFFDGECGLCHRTVRFLLAEDVEGRAFAYSPLQGEAFAQAVPPEEREALPDSMVVVTPCGDRLLRSDAVLYMASRLGGLWRVLAGASRWVPKPLRDGVYDGVARVRKAVFPAPKSACPIVPPDLARRFLP